MAIEATGVELDNGLKADLYITGAYITTLRGGKAAAARFEGFASREHSLSPQNAVWGLEIEFTPKGGELWEEAYAALKAHAVQVEEDGKLVSVQPFADAKNV